MYANLDIYFKRLWDLDPWISRDGKKKDKGYEFRKWFARQPLEYRKTISDEQYEALELEVLKG